MGIYISSKLLVGAHFSKVNKDKLKEKALSWKKSESEWFKDEIEKVSRVVEIHPRYKPDLLKLEEDAVDEFLDWKAEKLGIVFAYDYFDAGRECACVGFELESVIEIEEIKSAAWAKKIIKHAQEFEDTFGVKAALLTNQHVY